MACQRARKIRVRIRRRATARTRALGVASANHGDESGSTTPTVTKYGDLGDLPEMGSRPGVVARGFGAQCNATSGAQLRRATPFRESRRRKTTEHSASGSTRFARHRGRCNSRSRRRRTRGRASRQSRFERSGSSRRYSSYRSTVSNVQATAQTRSKTKTPKEATVYRCFSAQEQRTLSRGKLTKCSDGTVAY